MHLSKQLACAIAIKTYHLSECDCHRLHPQLCLRGLGDDADNCKLRADHVCYFQMRQLTLGGLRTHTHCNSSLCSEPSPACCCGDSCALQSDHQHPRRVCLALVVFNCFRNSSSTNFSHSRFRLCFTGSWSPGVFSSLLSEVRKTESVEKREKEGGWVIQDHCCHL